MAYHSTRTHSFVYATPNNSKRQLTLASQITMSDCTNVHQPVWPTFGRCSRIKIMALIRSSDLVARSSLISTIFGSESPGGSYRIFLSLVWWEREGQMESSSCGSCSAPTSTPWPCSSWEGRSEDCRSQHAPRESSRSRGKGIATVR